MTQIAYAVLLAGAGACRAISILTGSTAIRLDRLAGSNR